MIGVLSNEEARYLDLATLFVVMVNKNEEIAFISSSGAAILGYEREELIGSNWFDLAVPEPDRTLVRQIFAEVIQESIEPVEYYENPIIDRQGREFQLAWNNVMIRDESGAFKYSFSSGIDITEKKALSAHLVAMERTRRIQLLELSLEIQERERNNLAHELHDNVNQQLTAAKILLDYALIKTDDIRPTLELSINTLQKAINEIRKLTHDMELLPLEEASLADRINELALTVSASSKLAVNFNPSNASQLDESTTLAQQAVYRVVQEQVTNIIKHASATEVNIHLSIEPGSMEVEVRDDGIGFNLQDVKKGLGLKAMQNRIELLEGKLHLDTSPGQGCTLSIYVPLDSA